MRTTTSIAAKANHTTENGAIFNSPHVFNPVQKLPSSQGFIEPFPDNLEGPLDDFLFACASDRDSLRIPDWAGEIERRISQFEPISILAKRCGMHHAG